MKKMRILLPLLLWLLCQALAAHAEQAAEESTRPDAVRQACEGIVRVRCTCRDGDETLAVKEQTGFLVGKAGSDPCVVTGAEQLQFTKEELETLKEAHSVENNSRLSEELSIVFQGDVTIGASLVGSSSGKNIAILKLEQTVTDRFMLTFSAEEPRKGMDVCLLCFPLEAGKEQEDYRAGSVTIHAGTILATGKQRDNEAKCFTVRVAEDDGAVGGPFLAGDGTIMGMYVRSDGQETLALQKEEIMEFLELHNLPFAQKTVESTEKKPSKWLYVIGAVLLLTAGILVRQLWGLQKEQKLYETGPKKGLMKNGPKRQAFLVDTASGRQIEIHGTSFVIGSLPEGTHYTIENNRMVSRRHAAILLDHGRYYVMDLRSKNGTFLNGRRLQPSVRELLHDGSHLKIANAELVFCCGRG